MSNIDHCPKCGTPNTRVGPVAICKACGQEWRDNLPPPQLQKRRMPSTLGHAWRHGWLLWLLLLPAVALAFLFGDRFPSPTFLGILVAVFILLAIIANDYLNPRSAHRQFLDSNELAIARVARKRVERHTDSYGDVSYTYYLTIIFDHDGTLVELKARVNKEVHNMHRHGSQLKVRYAAANPQIALLEGEF